MLQWASQGSPHELFNPVAQTFRHFGILNLLAAMFLLDRSAGAPIGGWVYPLLRDIGEEALLQPIIQTFDSPVGGTTYGELLRSVRNKLTMHGELTEDTLPDAVRQVRKRKRHHSAVDDKTWGAFISQRGTSAQPMSLKLADNGERQIGQGSMPRIQDKDATDTSAYAPFLKLLQPYAQ